MAPIKLAFCAAACNVFRTSSTSPSNHSASPFNDSDVRHITERVVRPTLALCLITRDQNEDLLEWVEYHHSIGVTNIIIVDNNSSKASINSVMKHALSGFIIHYSYYSSHILRNHQSHAYQYCLKNYGSSYSHIGFIDTDEFIVIKDDSKSVIDVLETYSAFGGLTLNWMHFGSSGHIKRPKGGILKNYNKCYKNYHIKSIVNTKLTAGTSGDPHSFRYVDGSFAVDSNFTRVDGPFNPSSRVAPPDYLFSVIYLNHYSIKSYDDFRRKRARGYPDGNNINPFGFFKSVNDEAVMTFDYLTARSI